LMGSSLQAVPATELKENYQSIIERNPFGLKPPPPPATNNAADLKEKAKVEVFLTGLTAVDFPRLPKQAYFYTREQGKKDPTYYALNEGDGKDGIEVLSIDAQRRKVKIRMENKETLLSFETHGVPVAAVAGKPPIPGAPGIPAPGQPVIGQPGSRPGVPSTLPAPAPNSAGAMFDGNGQPISPNTAIAQRYGLESQPTTSGTGLRQIPSRRVRGGNANMNAPGIPSPGGGDVLQQPQQSQPVDVAEQYLRMHLNRAAQEREGVPMPPLPTME
jgi:hypothetical protein